MPMQVINDQVAIVLIEKPEEIEYYSDLLSRRHYLENSQINRNTILHVARRGREDVAIITWEPGVRRWFGLRDRLIGWSKSQRNQRLKYCVENRRFLMLVEKKNLASTVLARSVQRLNVDGEKMFGHPFMLAETFVDPSRGYEGTSYKAAGWSEVGLTQGGRGPQTRSRKRYFVRELQTNALGKLKSTELSPTDVERSRQTVLNLERLNLQSLKKSLDSVPDYRKHKGWYPLTAIFALMIAAVLAGQTNAKGIYRWISDLSLELLKSLGCRQAPSYSMIWRTLRETDHQALSQALGTWLSQEVDRIYIDRNLRILSLDGKALRTASKACDTDIHILSLIDTTAKVLLAQRSVGEKTNEIPVAQELLQQTELDAETIVTADAMHTQKKTAEIILKKTLITSFQSKTINQTSNQPSSTIPQKKVGQYRCIL